MTEIKEGKAQLVDNPLPDDGKVIVIQNQPIMDCALIVLASLGSFGKIVLKAKGDSIPTAVAVANIMTENMMKGNSKIIDITLDSENGEGKYGTTLVSTIKIIIAKTN